MTARFNQILPGTGRGTAKRWRGPMVRYALGLRGGTPPPARAGTSPFRGGFAGVLGPCRGGFFR